MFDTERRSYYPLCAAYKAARLADPEKTDAYLYRLRRATILEGRQTTLDEELISIAAEVGIDRSLFRQRYTDESAQAAFRKYLEYTRSLGIRGLPACLVQCGNQAALLSGMSGFHGFVKTIDRLGS